MQHAVAIDEGDAHGIAHVGFQHRIDLTVNRAANAHEGHDRVTTEVGTQRVFDELRLGCSFLGRNWQQPQRDGQQHDYPDDQRFTNGLTCSHDLTHSLWTLPEQSDREVQLRQAHKCPHTLRSRCSDWD